jgi:hypothetical protein
MNDKYYCNICNYTTGDHSNWYKHKRTKKHLEKVMHMPVEFNDIKINTKDLSSDNDESSEKRKPVMKKKEEEQIRFKCAYCDIEFKTNSGLYKHKKTCQYKEKADHAGLEDKLNILKEQNNYLKDFVYGAGNILKRSLSNTTFMNLHYNEAPSLEKHTAGIKDLKINKDENLFSVLTYYQKENILHQFIGDFIISIYKKENPKEQSLWTTDSSRLNYLVRTAIKNKNIWKIDKAGTKVRDNIICPILEEIYNEILKEMEYVTKDYINIKYLKVKELILLQQVIDNIDCNKLDHEINKYIAPHFNIDRDFLESYHNRLEYSGGENKQLENINEIALLQNSDSDYEYT